ncbi:MAG: permease [Deltaproteobacteria bacterium]|nr:permease [Deltaproteobacteria bacterium]MBW2305756.1 permease [Deltaproteobacteria bacterium]
MIWEVILGGLEALEEYVALHVITCLIPAFLLAGAMVSFVSKEAIIHYLGHAARKIQSFTLACFGSFFIAACSCTVIPVSSGLYYRGSGVGPAFILLWVAPAANILALVYTGAILGSRMVLARIAAAIGMAFIVGVVMSAVFAREEETRESIANPGAAASEKLMDKRDIVLLLLLVITLLAPNYLVQKGPYGMKVVVWAAFTALAALYALNVKSREEITAWLGETWWFVRLIFPLLLAGVFIVGVVGKILPETFIRAWLGGSGVAPSFLATLIGAISYFATMTEAPFVHTLMGLGMGKGPALALLLTGPGMSLPNMLAVARVFGARKAAVYVAMIIILGTAVGWAAGEWIFA